MRLKRHLDMVPNLYSVCLICTGYASSSVCGDSAATDQWFGGFGSLCFGLGSKGGLCSGKRFGARMAGPDPGGRIDARAAGEDAG